MKLEREKWMGYAVAALALVIVALSAIMALLMGGEGRLEAGFRLPRITPTALVTVEPTAERLTVTPAPTPVFVDVHREYPAEAVDVVADGRVLFTAESAESAWEALERYLAQCAAQNLKANERLIRAAFEQKLMLQEPSGKGKLLNTDEAVNTLMADEGLLPVSRTVVRCEIVRGNIETVSRPLALLPQGSRRYGNMGFPSYTLSYYETTYRGEAAYSEIKTNEFALGPGQADRLIENGAYAMEQASAKAGPEAREITGFSPLYPVSGEVETSFGMLGDIMHYSLDLAGESGGRVIAPEAGVVIYCGRRGDMGLVIDIQHDETGCVSRLIGCQSAVVELYQRVKKGEQVGVLPAVGAGRTATLRYELLIDGLPVNPEKYLPAQ